MSAARSSVIRADVAAGLQRRLSIPRLIVALGVVAAMVGAGFFGMRFVTAAADETKSTKSWFAGYVDVTATPSFAFESPKSQAGKNVVLSFIVSTPDNACVPSWGAAYSLDQASDSLDLDRRIARLQQQGGDIAVSFGGQANSELATGCTDVAKLAAAYESVIARYKITTIDLDIEGANLTDAAVNERRAEAIATVQKDRRAIGKSLAVWFTLPTTPTGLDASGLSIVQETLAKKVDIAGVNFMTMDFGGSLANGASQLDASTSALTAGEHQLGVLYRQAGVRLADRTLWSKVGVTPMIGQNDVRDEVMTLAAAKSLNSFAVAHGIGRVSMWSLNRDVTCGSNYITLTVVSDSCSGIAQGSKKFAVVLGASLRGRPLISAAVVTTAEPVSISSEKDDPKTSPYPVWAAPDSYLQGAKIVWHHNVYQAKWWTSGDLPDNPVLNAWQTPWLLVGPVLKGEVPVVVPTLPAGTYPDWSGTGAYQKAERVLYNGVPYEAKWWNQAQSPDAASANPDSSPWVPLTIVQLDAVVAALKK